MKVSSNEIKISEKVMNHLTKEFKFSKKDIISIFNKFNWLLDEEDDEIIEIFDGESKYNEFRFKDNAYEMFCWLNDEKNDVFKLANYIIPENCAGKTLAEAYVENQDNILILSDGTCIFQC